MPFVEGQAVVGGGAKFATDSAGHDGGVIQLVKTVWGPDGNKFFIDDATGLRFPVKATISDASDADVKPGDSTLSALRVNVVGGATVAEFQIDSAPYTAGTSGGVPAHFFFTNTSVLLADGDVGAARCSDDRIQYATSLPRANTTQNNVTITTTSEVTLLAAGASGVFHDIAALLIYTDNITAPVSVCPKVLLRDSTGGTTRFTVPLAEKGGSNINFGSLRLKQATAANNWTVALSAALTSVYVHVIAEVRRS